MKYQYKDCKDENTKKAEQLRSQIHTQQHQQGMQTNLFTDDFRFDNIAYDWYDKIQDQQPDTRFYLVIQKTDENPGNHDTTGSKDWQYIKNGN